MTGDSIELLELSAISDDQRASLAALTLPEAQYEYGGNFKSSMAECDAGDEALIRGLVILAGQTPIGIVLLKRPPLSPNWASEDAITLHGLKIDRRWQGRGYGRAALRKTIEVAKKIWPSAQKLALTVDAENSTARELYRQCGMQEVGVPTHGRIGLEHHFEIRLDEGVLGRS